MIRALLQKIEALNDSNGVWPTRAEVHAEMVRDGSFDPAAKMSFNQLVGFSISECLAGEMIDRNDKRSLVLCSE